MSVPPCPLNDRRTPRELYVKIFVVNFMVLAAYGHLIQRRKDKFINIRVLLALISPAGGAIMLLITLLALLIQIPLCRNIHEIKKSANLLLGPAPSPWPVVSNRPPNQDVALPSVVWERLKRILIPTAVSTQSITSIWLFKRRVHRDADHLYDHRILQLALLGTVTGLSTMLHEALQPQYPDINFAAEPWRIRWLSFLRMIDEDGMDADALDSRSWMRKYLVLISFGMAVGAVYHISLKTTALTEVEMDIRGLWVGISSAQCLAITLTSVLIWWMLSRDTADKTKRVVTKSAMLAFCVSLAFAVPYMGNWAVALWPWTLMSGVLDYWNLLQPRHGFGGGTDSIASFAALPVDSPCPQAWKDPVADYVWWLA